MTEKKKYTYIAFLFYKIINIHFSQGIFQLYILFL